MNILYRLVSFAHIPNSLKRPKVAYPIAGSLILVIALSSFVLYRHQHSAPTNSTVKHFVAEKASTKLPDINTAEPSASAPTASQTTSTSATKPTKVTPPTAQTSSPLNVSATPHATPSITAHIGNLNTVYFNTVNFSSSSYLAVVHPIQSRFLTSDVVTSLGFTVTPVGPGNSQTGSFLLTYPGMLGYAPIGGEVYAVTVCTNVNGSCGLSANPVTMTITELAPPHP